MHNIVLPFVVIFVIPSSSSAPICTGCQIEQKGYTSRINPVGQECQTDGQRAKCGRRRNILWHSAKAWPPNLSFEKLFSKRKKCFKLKLRENSHEVMVNTCNKARVVLQVAAREVITFFFLWISAPFRVCITQFPEIVAWSSGDLQIMP